MEYLEIKPYKKLARFIHSYWELNGDENDGQWERNFPDGCAGLVVNLGDTVNHFNQFYTERISKGSLEVTQNYA